MDYKKLSRIVDFSSRTRKVQDSASTSRKVTSILKRLGVNYYWDADRRCYRLEGPIPNLKEVLNKIESQLPENASLLRESCDIQIWDSANRTRKVQDSVKKFDEVDAQDELNKLAKSLGDGWDANADWGYGELSYECLSEDSSEFEEMKKKAQKFLPNVKKVFGNAKVEDDGEFMVYITVEYESEED